MVHLTFQSIRDQTFSLTVGGRNNSSLLRGYLSDIQYHFAQSFLTLKQTERERDRGQNAKLDHGVLHTKLFSNQF